MMVPCLTVQPTEVVWTSTSSEVMIFSLQQSHCELTITSVALQGSSTLCDHASYHAQVYYNSIFSSVSIWLQSVCWSGGMLRDKTYKFTPNTLQVCC